MSFKKWAYDPTFLPSLEDISDGVEDLEGKLSDFIVHNPLGTPFQVLNKEFIKGISDELLKVIKEISDININILEVGAGNGRLSYFLNKELTIENVKKNVKVIATDNFSWFNCDNPHIWIKKNKGIPVEQLNIIESIEKYNPNIIISSWMPQEDWTKVFRESSSIEAFLLIGDNDDCGNNDSWKECNLFKPQELEIEGNISWRDSYSHFTYIQSPDYQPQSKIILFKGSM